MTDLKNEIHDYWTNRARGYSEYNQQEMADARLNDVEGQTPCFAGKSVSRAGTT